MDGRGAKGEARRQFPLSRWKMMGVRIWIEAGAFQKRNLGVIFIVMDQNKEGRKCTLSHWIFVL